MTKWGRNLLNFTSDTMGVIENYCVCSCYRYLLKSDWDMELGGAEKWNELWPWDVFLLGRDPHAARRWAPVWFIWRKCFINVFHMSLCGALGEAIDYRVSWLSINDLLLMCYLLPILTHRCVFISKTNKTLIIQNKIELLMSSALGQAVSLSGLTLRIVI